MKILQIIITGLFTDPANPTTAEAIDATKDCGMLETAEAIRDQHPEHEHQIETFSWDGSSSPDANCRAILAVIVKFNPDIIFTHHHSFGNDLFIFFIDWLTRWYATLKIIINFAFGYDPCKNGLFGNIGWAINRAIVKDWRAWFQRNFKPWGVCGSGFYDPDGGHNIDVTATGDGHVTQDGYTGVPDDDNIRDEVYFFANNVITEISLSLPAAPESSPAQPPAESAALDVMIDRINADTAAKNKILANVAG